MEIINNRYRIVKSLKQNRVVSSYVVNDIIKNYDTIQLNILSSEYIPQELIEFYTKEFISLTNLQCKNITSVFDFDLVNLLDNNRLNDKIYFYTNEYVQDNYGILDLVTNMKEDRLLDLFIEICQSVNYLHLKGFIYGDINLYNIQVDYNENSKKNSIKFKDIATVELEKCRFWNDENNQVYFKAPEILKGEKTSISSDVYSLGILLFILYLKSKNENFDLQEEIKLLSEFKIQDVLKTHEEFDINFKKLIYKMVDSEVTKRYENISQLVKDINILFHKEYVAHRTEELEKLNFNLKMIGRDEEINKIMNMYDAMINKNIHNATVFVHGESGIGKTRFLKAIKYLFSLRKVNVYSSFILDASTKNSNKAFVDILKQLISGCQPEVLERYESELVKFIPELGGKKSITPSEPLNGEKEKFRLINRAGCFIEECINNVPIVIVIDNFHLADDFTIELVKYLKRKKILNKNIMLLLSYCDGECFLNKKFTEFIKNEAEGKDVSNIFLKELNEIEVAKMIKDILSLPGMPHKFAENVFKKTKGNPLFVQEIIKSVFSRKYIYVDKDAGYWTKDYEYSEFEIPSNMHEILLNQLKDMDEYHYKILKIISIFNNAVSLEIINNFIEEQGCILEKVIEELVSLGILCKKIEDRGFVFDFYNKFLKNLIYEKISQEDKKAMHKLATILLENQYTQGGTEYIEELIYHLEKSDQKQKIIDYCIENAEKMKALKNRSDAIKNLTKAVSIMDNALDPIKNINLITDLADLHVQEGNSDLAINYYLSIEEYNWNNQLTKYVIDNLIKVADVYYNKNNINSTIEYLDKSEVLLEKTDYLEGELQHKALWVAIYNLRQENEKTEALCNKYMEMCNGQYEKFKIPFNNILGLVYLNTDRVEESLKTFEKGITICNKYKNTKGLIRALNNIGVIYADYYQDDDKSVEYFLKIKEICEKNNMGSNEIVALINIGGSHFSKENYEISLQYFNEALEKCKKYEYEYYVFYCYGAIASVFLKLNDYTNAYKYYCLCNKELENYPIQGKDIGEFYFMASELNYKFGDLQKASHYIEKALDLYEHDNSIFKWQSKALNECIKFQTRQNDKNVIDNVDNIISIANKISSVSNRINIFYDAIICLYESNKQEYIPNILKEIYNIKFNIKDYRVYAKKLYVDGLIEKKKNIKFLMESLEYSKKYKETSIYWKVYILIGDYYFDKKDYLYAVIYYFEACGVLKDIILQLPVEYRLNFVKQNNALNPFNKFLCVNNYYKNNKDITLLEIEEINIESEEELLSLLEQVNHKDILKNKNFIKSMKKLYSSSLQEDIHDINDVLDNLQSDNTKNLELIIDYLSYITLGTRGTIIINDNDKKYRVIAASDRSFELPQNEEVLSKILNIKKPVLSKDVPLQQILSGDKNSIHNNIKSYICVPVIMENKNEKEITHNDRRRNIYDNKHIIGYVYIESQRVLNNFNQDSMKKCIELSKLIGIIIEKYKLRLSASIDKLTGTLTRKYLEEALDEQLETSSQSGSSFSLIMYDLDHFKMINDKFGHRTGDYALKKVCEVVMNNLRETDIVGRYGGEEFIVILPDTDIEDAEIVAEKLRKKIEEEKILDNRRDVTVSLGVISYPLQGQWQDELVEKVDQALYVAKEQGRNRYAVWDSEFSKKAKRTDKLTGIISGNAIQDHRNVLAMIDLIELISKSISREDKIYNLLGRIIEVTEAQNGILFIMDEKIIAHKYSRQIFKKEWISIDTYNDKIVNSVINSKQGVYKIDWDTITEYDTVTGVPNWQSVMVIPLIHGDTVRGVLYLTESTQTKEFDFDDFNFVNTLGQIITPIL